MTYEVKEDAGQWTVVNSETGEVKATHDTEDEAKRQCKLLNQIDADPSWDE